MTTKECTVVRGVVEVNISDAPRFSGGRTFEHRRLFHVGERVTLAADETARLTMSGAVKAVS